MYLYEDTINALELYESSEISFYDLVESVEEGQLSEAVINEYFAEQFEFVEAWQNGEVSDEELVEAIEEGYLDYELVEGVIGNTVKKVWNSVKGHTQALAGRAMSLINKDKASKLLHKAKQSFYDAGNKDKAVKLKRLANSIKPKKEQLNLIIKPKERGAKQLRAINYMRKDGNHDDVKYALNRLRGKKITFNVDKKLDKLRRKYNM